MYKANEMKIFEEKLPGLLRIELDLYKDNRGYFVERFHEDKFFKAGLPTHFVQDNHSFSISGVLRGLHFQYDPFQGKLVGVTRGKVWDVAVDIRPHSPTYKKWVGLELSAVNGCLLWVPPGFAHGFIVLGTEPADVFYKVDKPYNPLGDRGIIWDDPELNITWPIDGPILSAKDAQLPTFEIVEAEMKSRIKSAVPENNIHSENPLSL